MDGRNASRAPAPGGDQMYNDHNRAGNARAGANGAPGPAMNNSGRGGGVAGNNFYGARGQGFPGGLGMYGGNDANAAAPALQGVQAQRFNAIYGAASLGAAQGLRGLMPGQLDDPSGGMAGLQVAQGGMAGAAGLGGLNAMNSLGAQGQQQLAAQQQAMAAQQRAAAGGCVDFQGLMPTGFDGTDASAALLGNPAAMAGYPFQTGFNPAAAGLGMGADGSSGAAGAGLLNPNAAMAGAPGAAMVRNAQFGNAVNQGPGGNSLFDQGYNFARSEMALVRHQAALNNNAVLMSGGGQAAMHLAAGLDRQNAAGLRVMGPGGVNPYSTYGADPLMGAAGPVGGADPYMGRGGPGDGNPAGTQHLATIPAIRLAQHRSALQRRMMVNNLPERKDGSFPVVLYQESDEHKLTAYQCLLRKQLELFEADEDDVRCSTRQGRTAPIKLGQVGLRCRHCAGVQLAARTKGAAYYSQTVEGIYQIAQNMSKVHLCERCYRIPRDVRRQLIVLRSDCRRAIGGKEYWSENIRALGVYVDEGILRVKRAPKEDAKEGESKEGEDKDGEAKEGETKDGEAKEETKTSDESKDKDENMGIKEEVVASADTEKKDSPAEGTIPEEEKRVDESIKTEGTDEAMKETQPDVIPMDEDKDEGETKPTEADEKKAEDENKAESNNEEKKQDEPETESTPMDEEKEEKETKPLDADDKKAEDDSKTERESKESEKDGIKTEAIPMNEDKDEETTPSENDDKKTGDDSKTELNSQETKMDSIETEATPMDQTKDEDPKPSEEETQPQTVQTEQSEEKEEKPSEEEDDAKSLDDKEDEVFALDTKQSKEEEEEKSSEEEPKPTGDKIDDFLKESSTVDLIMEEKDEEAPRESKPTENGEFKADADEQKGEDAIEEGKDEEVAGDEAEAPLAMDDGPAAGDADAQADGDSKPDPPKSPLMEDEKTEEDKKDGDVDEGKDAADANGDDAEVAEDDAAAAAETEDVKDDEETEDEADPRV